MPDNPPNVAYLLGSVDRGGTETLLLDCFRNANEAGFSFIGLYRRGGTLLESFLETGIPFFRLGFKYWPYFGYLFRLRKILIKKSVDIVHAQQPLDALLALIALRGTGIKIVLTIHGYDFSEKKKTKIINGFILNRTDMNIFVSYAQMDYFVREYNIRKPYKMMVIHNGISFAKFDNLLPGSLRETLEINNETLLICSIGNFVPVRDQMTICRFLALLKKTGKNFRMIFAGARSDKTPQLYDDCVSFCREQGLAENVSFLGSRKDVPDLLKQCDVFIYASDHDTFGLAVIEAIAAGIPVFVNDWEVMKEVTENGKYASLYRTKDEYHLLNLFIQFLDDPEPYQIKAKNSALWIRDNFSIKKHMVALNEAYSGLF